MNYNIKSTIFLATIIFSASFVASTANAAPESNKSDAMKAKMQKIDTDGDGKFSRAEIAQYKGLAKNFDKIDTNNDGYLTKDEMKAQHAKSAESKLKAIDSNQDGRISRAEADAKTPMLAKHFDKIDANKDGFIDKAEMETVRLHRQRRQ